MSAIYFVETLGKVTGVWSNAAQVMDLCVLTSDGEIRKPYLFDEQSHRLMSELLIADDETAYGIPAIAPARGIPADFSGPNLAYEDQQIITHVTLAELLAVRYDTRVDRPRVGDCTDTRLRTLLGCDYFMHLGWLCSLGFAPSDVRITAVFF
jgi:hypothetical protein